MEEQMNKKTGTAAIILAGGKGTRMNSRTLKQYLFLENKPVLFYSLNTFSKLDIIDEIVLVVNEGEEEYCREEIINAYNIGKVKSVTVGGAERYDSVWNGIRHLSRDIEYVMIHDSARPLIKADTIIKAYNVLVNKGSCVVGVHVKDTIKQTDKDGIVDKTLQRSSLWVVQTPQCFKKDALYDAYNNMYSQIRNQIESDKIEITDDAMIMERFGCGKIYMAEGEYTNIKITTPEDMGLAKLYLNYM